MAVMMRAGTHKRLLMRCGFVILMLCLCACRAHAAGGTLHIFMSELALERVTDPELKRLLEANRKVVLWASWYPDSGYQSGNEYGEFSHWSTFFNGYMNYIKNDITPANPDYEMLAAHFLGAAAHGMEDQVFDQLFLALTHERDGTGQAELDRGLDMVCMFDHARYDFSIPEEIVGHYDVYTPVAHLANIYRQLGMPYRNIEKQIVKGQRYLALGIQGEKILFGLEHNGVRATSPWAAANYYTAPGGVLHNAEIIAAYWDALWRKLKGQPTDFVIGTFPRNGDMILSTNHNTVDSSISVFFDGKYNRETINPDTFIVRDTSGGTIQGTFNYGYGSNMFRFIPSGDYAPGAAYTVTLTAGIQDEFGAPMPHPYSFEFKTAEPSSSISGAAN